MKRPKPDTRPKWNDPNLPVIRRYRFPNGSEKIEVDPDYERRYREHMLNNSQEPDYRNDPTYNARTKHDRSNSR